MAWIGRRFTLLGLLHRLRFPEPTIRRERGLTAETPTCSPFLVPAAWLKWASTLASLANQLPAALCLCCHPLAPAAPDAAANSVHSSQSAVRSGSCQRRKGQQRAHLSLPVSGLPTGAGFVPPASTPTTGQVIAVQDWSLSAREGNRGGRRQGWLRWPLPRGPRLIPGGCPGAEAALC